MCLKAKRNSLSENFAMPGITTMANPRINPVTRAHNKVDKINVSKKKFSITKRPPLVDFLLMHAQSQSRMLTILSQDSKINCIVKDVWMGTHANGGIRKGSIAKLIRENN